MNTAGRYAVEAPTTTARVVLATLVCLGVHGCDDVSGSAVELSWILRPPTTTDAASCAQTRIRQMRLLWDVAGDAGSQAWPCTDTRAVTDFDLPAGEATLWVVPECDGGPAAEDTYEAPAPVVRTLAVGEVVSLDAVVVQVQIANCSLQPCICQ